MCKRRPRRRRALLPLATNIMQRARPFPSRATEREKGERRPSSGTGLVSTTAPETHGPCSGLLVAKSLVYGPGPGCSWGDRASSLPRFNTYSRGFTHLSAARPAPGFFLPFSSLTVGTSVSSLLVGTQDSGLGTW
jgi:hypothetical protein